jgi:T-complex protein 1 subunit eta
MDKMIENDRGTTVSNDGATIIGLLDIEHPAAKILVDIAKSQDNEVGDGTTSVVVFAGELMKECKNFIEEGMLSYTLIDALNQALKLALEKLKEFCIDVGDDKEKKREMLIKCAETALNSKLLSNYKTHFAELVV